MLSRLHEGHFSLDKCRKRAQYSVWWPEISRELGEFVDRCSFCQVHKRRNKSQPMKATPLPDRPWQRLGADLCEWQGKMYLVLIDYFSRWIEVEHLIRSDSETVVQKLYAIFARFGLPETLRSDGGPQFSSNYFKKFVDKLCFTHELSDPYFSQANGCAERAVQVAKRILKTEDSVASLLAYRNTPVDATGCSPAQLLMGRRLRTNLPMLSAQLTPNWPNMGQIRKSDNLAKTRSKENFDRAHGARPLSNLREG